MKKVVVMIMVLLVAGIVHAGVRSDTVAIIKDLPAGSTNAHTDTGWVDISELLSETTPVNYFPVFWIPLGDAGHEWTDFELKATTNNFDSGGTNIAPDLVYMYSSSSTSSFLDDRNCVVYFTDSGATDNREWIKSPANTSIASQLTDANSAVRWCMVYPSTNLIRNNAVAEDATTAIHPNNTNLFFVFTRYDGVNFEKDDGDRQIWSPIKPLRWLPEHRVNRYDGAD